MKLVMEYYVIFLRKKVDDRIKMRFAYLIIFSLFGLWALIFISKSSFIGIDGTRYFSLFDDAMISMRYAWNFSHGNGLVWNHAEYVEGYTNLLMVLTMALPSIVLDKPGAVLVIQLMGIVYMFAIASLTIRIGSMIFQKLQLPNHRFSVVLLAVGVFAYYPLVYWSLMGMETGLISVLLLAVIYLTIKYWDNSNIHPLIGVVAGLVLSQLKFDG